MAQPQFAENQESYAMIFQFVGKMVSNFTPYTPNLGNSSVNL